MSETRMVRCRIGQIAHSQLLHIAQSLEFRCVDELMQRVVDVYVFVDDL